jgi:N,N'-diacetyllegionaminate synthase
MKRFTELILNDLRNLYLAGDDGMGCSAISVGNRCIGPGQPVFIIAEIGMNHNGDLGLAKELVYQAAHSGADAVKFQTFKSELFYSEKYFDISERKRMELKYEWHQELKKISMDCGVEFISTPLDFQSADFLDEIGVPCFKIASCDLTNYPFIRYIAEKGKPIIISTGFSVTGEIEKAVNTAYNAGNSNIVLLHCISEYPAAVELMNLKAISRMEDIFGLNIGLSDHSAGNNTAVIAAVALGARVIEKHFTIDRNLQGYDHHMSETPDTFREMAACVRTVEKAMGTGIKKPTAKECERLSGARRSLYWKDEYTAGSVIREDMFSILRPGIGLAPEKIEELTGKLIKKGVQKGELVRYSQIEWND